MIGETRTMSLSDRFALKDYASFDKLRTRITQI